MMKALGFIETMGLLPAIEAADAMLKAADVRLVEKSLASGGLVTITVTGEVAAVKASVDAGAAAVARIQGARLVSKHVIARPDDELEKIFDAKKAVKKDSTPAAAPKPASTPAAAPKPEKAAPAASEAPAQSAPPVKSATPVKSTAKKKNVTAKKKR